MMRSIIAGFLLLVSIWPGRARAEWLEASSNHFVIYANDQEEDLRHLSEQLERYHSALALLLENHSPPPSPSNRVTVYVVRSEQAVRDLYGANSKYVGGFYIPRAGASLAVLPKVESSGGKSDYSMIVLLHEYTHHFMISTNGMPMPRWLSEGAAEFFATSSFEANGGIMLGRAAQHRAGELFYGRDVKAADLLDPTDYEKSQRSFDSFYGKSWLLYHYLTFEPTRKGQMSRYVELLSKGKGLREAASEAFGDFAKLERDLDRYLDRRRLAVLKLRPDMLQAGAIAIRKISAGEAAMMPIRMRSRRGVNSEQAKSVLTDARNVAVRFPKDAAVLSALAEAEFDAGNTDAAIAAADAAIAIDPAQLNAYVQKGYALFRVAEQTSEAEKEAAYQRARRPFVLLNRLENDHPLPLIFYYRSFAEQGKALPPLAIAGLIRAVELAPFDLGLRMTLATALIREDRQADARIMLQPVAFNPHGGPLATSARALLTRLDNEPGWKGMGLEDVVGNIANGPQAE